MQFQVHISLFSRTGRPDSLARGAICNMVSQDDFQLIT